MKSQQTIKDLELIGNMHLALADLCERMPDFLSARLFCYEGGPSGRTQVRPEIRLLPAVFDVWAQTRGPSMRASPVLPGAWEVEVVVSAPRGDVSVIVVRQPQPHASEAVMAEA